MHVTRVQGYDTIQPGRNVLAFLRSLLTLFVLLDQILSNISEFLLVYVLLYPRIPSFVVTTIRN
jgi:hypothetical protein